jgi:peptidoglycan/LPS O-acetylase OafA/YrhL
MQFLAISHSAVSLATLVMGLFAWRLTSSRSVVFNTVLGSAGLLLAAYLVQSHQSMELSYIIPFLVFALFGGRAIGLGWRSRKEQDLRSAATLLGAVSIICLTLASVTFMIEGRG